MEYNTRHKIYLVCSNTSMVLKKVTQMNLEQYNYLPVSEIAEQVNQTLAQSDTVIINAPAGAGKSTLLPLTIFKDFGGKILMLEPRRLAAKSIATRMSEMLGQQVGQTIGYRIRFENKTSQQTEIEILTEGILTRMLQTDNELKGVKAVIFDEFHERSLFAETALALCRECQKILRPDLKIIIMSATLNIPQLAEKLCAPVVTSKGKMFDVEIEYSKNDCNQYTVAEESARATLKLINQKQGDILIFLPGEAEIRRCEELLKKSLPQEIKIHPLYGMLPAAQQHVAIIPNNLGKRKIVIATPIAETSLTIQGITIVIDGGFCRVQTFDPNTALPHLETIRISQDMAIQRAGRAGRLSKGYCLRLYTNTTWQRMKPTRTPEIETADLAPLLLDLAKWGENNANNLFWLTKPPQSHIIQAKQLLLQLEAIDQNGNITPHGTEINRIPTHPRIAQMLTTAIKLKLTPLAADIAAILENRDFLTQEEYGVDINARIDALRKNRRENRHNRTIDNIEKISQAYRKMLNTSIDNNNHEVFDTGLLLSQAFPERIAYARPGNNARFQLANGSLAIISHNDSLSAEPWIAIASLNESENGGKIFSASPLDPTDLKPLLKTRENFQWNTKLGGLIAKEELRLGAIVLQEKPIRNIDTEKIAELIIQAIKKEGENLLDFNDEITELQNRICSLRIWNGEQWPDFSTQNLINTCDKWLKPYLNGISTTQQLKKISLKDPLLYSLDYNLQQQANKLAPEKIKVPTGHNIKLKYYQDGRSPILAVRLQEVFGMTETPKINNNTQPITMHLLSPGFKLVQITSDLKSFWANAYYEVRKQLKTRYPKHKWPDL